MIQTDEVYTITAQDAASNGAAAKGFSAPAMLSREKVVTVEFDGETGDVWYRPWAITPRVMRELTARRAADETDSIGRVMDQLCEFISRWDVLGTDGQRLPVTVETMTGLPNPFLVAVLTAVSADMSPSPTSGVASSLG